jgi:hypothetical protein
MVYFSGERFSIFGLISLVKDVSGTVLDWTVDRSGLGVYESL